MAIFDLTEDDTTPRRLKPPLTRDQRERHSRALTAFKASASFFAQQRKREVKELKFTDFDEQWDPTVKTQRAGNQSVNGLPPTPPRPTIVVNQIRGPLQQVANARRSARLALEFAPKGPGSTDDIAEVYEDIVRGMQQESRANIARNWAADRSEKCGLGWYRLDTEYEADADPADKAAWNDQVICYRRILNQASVYADPFAQEPDFSDGRRWFVTEDLPIDVYRERFPDSDLTAYSDGELTAIGDSQKQWVFTAADDDGSATMTVRIAECWEVTERETTLVMLADGRAVDEDAVPEGMTIAAGTRRRKKVERVIFWSLMNAVEYLEEPREWDGAYVPLIPTIGNEFNVDGERRWSGMVQPAMDAQLSYNVMRSAQIEQIGLATKAPYIGFMETIEPYLEWWKQSNIRNYFILPIKAAYDKAGNLLPMPKRNVEEPAIQAMTIATAAAKDDIHMTTGVPPAALGQLDPHDRSGKAIQALQGQSEIGASGYLDNLVNISMAYEGKVLRDMIPRYYDRPGRVVPAVGVDEQRRLVMLNAPFYEGPDGRPVQVPGWQEGDPVPPQVTIPGPNGQPTQVPVKYYNLKAGAVSVTPVVGKSYATRRQEASAAIGEVLSVVPPEMAAVLAPAWLEEQDYPGARRLAEIAKNALPPAMKAAYGDEPAPIPPEVQAQLGAMQQQMQELQKMADTNQAKLMQTQMQEQGDSERAQLDRQTQIDKALISAQATMAKETMAVDAENFRSYVDAGMQKLSQDLDLKMSMIGDHLNRLHEAMTQAREHQHEKEIAAMQHHAAMQQAQQAHQQALEQGQQAAALAPEPTNGGGA